MAKCPDLTLKKEVEKGLKALRASDLQKIDLSLDGRSRQGGWMQSAGGRPLRVNHVVRVNGRALTMPNTLDPCSLKEGKDDVTFVMVTQLRDLDVVKSFRTWWNARAEAMGKKKKKEENEKKDTIDDDSKTPPPPSELHF